MIERYSYIEPIFKGDGDVDKCLSVEGNDKSVLRLFRVLSGTCRIKDEFTNKNIRFATNYFNFPYTKNIKYSKKCVSDIFSDGIKLSEIAEFFESLNTNEDFYSSIEAEVLNCIVARKDERYLESFIFLYRILEGVSYSIPLIYVSKAKNFKKSFKSLQLYMPKSAQNGELEFFKKFIKEVYSEEYFYNITVDIKMSDIEIEELRSTYYGIYKDKLKQEFIEGEVEDDEINVSFFGYFQFMIEIRNRYFHFLQGTWHDNIESRQILHPDLFFKPLVDLGINWVATILFEIIRFDIDKEAAK